MTTYLTIHVRAHDGRYHGDGDEFPSPFRLFQALVAGAGISGPLDQGIKDALTWLEGLPDAPVIAAPRMVRGQAFTMFMPNNDLDKFGGDVRNIAKTRGAQKVWRPRHFDATVPWIYAWRFEKDGETYANAICALAERLYQLGRGVDMAWAWGEVLDEAALDAKLGDYDGIVLRPSTLARLQLACPERGSLNSLICRHRARRFRTEGGQRVFVQQPKPAHRKVSYESPPARHLFMLRSSIAPERRVTWPLEGASSLVVAAREAARARLVRAMPSRVHEVERHLVGRRSDGSNAAPPESRIRIIPLPSIGTHHADRAIRRLLVDIPAACPLRGDDVRWAFSGADLVDPETGEVKDMLLSPSDEHTMLQHYGVGERARVFRSVTPVVLPTEGRRRRIDPRRKLADAKHGLERLREVSAASAAVVQALRHADVRVAATSIRLQREPFEGSGSRVEDFAPGTRFEKERFWHVEITFDAAIEGPLLIGDGRFLGLGLLAPVRDLVPALHVFEIEDGLAARPDFVELSRALRRAVMARVGGVSGAHECLRAFFSGHGEDGRPARREQSPHLAFAFDSALHRLLVVAPHLVERRPPTWEETKCLRTLDHALEGFGTLRAGRSGLLKLRRRAEADTGHLLASAVSWRTLTPYTVTRHLRRISAAEALVDDVKTECSRLGLHPIRVETSDVLGVPGRGLTGHVSLAFKNPVSGPILLGRTRHLGGGLFLPTNFFSSDT